MPGRRPAGLGVQKCSAVAPRPPARRGAAAMLPPGSCAGSRSGRGAESRIRPGLGLPCSRRRNRLRPRKLCHSDSRQNHDGQTPRCGRLHGGRVCACSRSCRGSGWAGAGTGAGRQSRRGGSWRIVYGVAAKDGPNEKRRLAGTHRPPRAADPRAAGRFPPLSI